ncbi:glycosyltransferase family 25 protein [Methylobacter sp. Wu1]|uniref:glycosyltransferase family 25 protein n=1 Tax=Methylobacter sp. Wu1 TaxID=3119359 RepID=UPI002F94014A
MKLTDYFQRIYIINLPYRTDRKREINAQLKKIGLSLEHPQIDLFPAVRPDDAGYFPSIGARGCFMSHLNILRDAKKRGLENVLIIEDDLDFSPDFNSRIDAAIVELTNSNWGVFYGGGRLLSDVELSNNSELSKVNHDISIQTTHFIGFNQSIIAAMMDHLESILTRPAGHPDGGPMHVDGAYSWFRRHHQDVLTLIAVNELGHQRSSRTDIHELRWFDKTPVISVIVDAIRCTKRIMAR